MIKIGSVVLATAGKEKGGIFVVTALSEGYVYLADGKRLKTKNPKKKSLKHIKMFGNQSLEEGEVLDPNERANAKIRKFLSALRSENV